MKKIVIILFTLISLYGCKTLFSEEGHLLSDAKVSYKKGDYYSAVLSTAEAIKIDNEYRKAIKFLIDLYPEANSHYLALISEAPGSENKFINDEIAANYKKLYSINEKIRILPLLYHPKTEEVIDFPYTDYSGKLKEANNNAAEDHYQEGLSLLEAGNREGAKQAAKEFERSVFFIANYKDSAEMLTKAKEAGTQVLAFLPFENHSRNRPRVQFLTTVVNSIISSLKNDSFVMKFTKIIDPDISEAEDSSDINILVTGSIDSVKIEGPSTQMTKERREKKIQVKEDVKSNKHYVHQGAQEIGEDDENENFYTNNASSDGVTDKDSTQYKYVSKKIHADVFIYRKSIKFDTIISYKAVDTKTGIILKTGTVNISAEDSCSWAEWRGNENALTRKDRQLINKYEESVMSEEQISIKAATDAGVKIAEGLAEYLR